MRRTPRRTRAAAATATAGLALVLGACALTIGGPRDIPLTTLALRTADGAGVDAAAGALRAADADVALIAGPADSAWFSALAGAAGLTLSGPAITGDLGLGFLGEEPVGDTTIVLPYDGGVLTVRDALYDMGRERFLDLLAFEVEGPDRVERAMRVLLEYMATDVMNSAAVIIAVVVPSAATGDAVARLLSPAYFDALRCDPGVAPPSDRSAIRLFYGPEARVYCTDAVTGSSAAGETVRASLVVGRR